MRLDLHIHTTASDGDLDPDQVVAEAVAGGLDVIAITDHDTTAGVGPALEAARDTGLTVVPGTELSSTRDGREIHVLGYGVDRTADALEAHRARARRIRLERMEWMVVALEREEGIAVAMDQVLDAAGPNREMVGRPHLARVLVAEGHARDLPDAFDRYIADHRPSFVPTALQDPVDAVRTIRAAGGVAVWAHPPLDLLEGLLPELVEAGLQGLEVHRPEARNRVVRRLRNAAKREGLVTSGGSDWHNLRRNRPLGHFWVGRGKVEPLIELLGLGSSGG